MTDDADASNYLTVMTTEHFALQSSSAATITEAGQRSSMYLMSLSSALVALGFTASNREVFPFLAGVTIPVVFALGCFTIVRLVDTTLENLGFQTRITRVYEYYASLAPYRHNFPIGHATPNEAQMRYRIKHRYPFLTTMASMIGAVNSIVGGVAVAYLLGVVTAVPTVAATAIGAVAALLLFAGVVVYQHRRFAGADAGRTDR